jgi:hypothetical protein
MIVICAGSHRSGSSALAGLLHSNGIVMGETKNFIPRPKKKQNAKGFFENYRFRQINDLVLKQFNYAIKSYNPNTIPEISGCQIFYIEAYNLLIEYMQKYKTWGWKDPRNCLTLAFWLDVIKTMGLKENTHILIIKRNVEAIARSMKARRNRGSIEKLTLLSKKYYSFLEKYSVGWDTTTLHFENLCENPQEEIQKCPMFIKEKVTDFSFLDKNLVHH